MYGPLTPPTLGDREQGMSERARNRARAYKNRMIGVLADLTVDEQDEVVAYLGHYVDELRRKVEDASQVRR